MTFEEYCSRNWNREPYPIIDHALRISKNADGTFSFYIHPASTSGLTEDYVIKGNTLEERIWTTNK